MSFVLAAYVVPACAVWAALGLVLGAVSALGSVVAPVACLTAGVYGLGYGVVEVSGLAWPAAPGRRWQVPQGFLIGADSRRRVLIWGAILGPGWLTRNPYAAFGLLPLLVLGTGQVVAAVVLAALIGAAHGSGRALALLRDAAAPSADPFELVLRSIRWRQADGVALLAVAGAALMVAARLPR